MPKDSQNICDELKSTVVCREVPGYGLPYLELVKHNTNLFVIFSTPLSKVLLFSLAFTSLQLTSATKTQH
jgi:hypothetical protein